MFTNLINTILQYTSLIGGVTCNFVARICTTNAISLKETKGSTSYL